MPEIKKKISQQRVGIDSEVLLKFESDEIVTYMITHPDRTNPDRGIISYDSPLGKALLGKKEGDKITYVVGSRIFQADILEIAVKARSQ